MKLAKLIAAVAAITLLGLSVVAQAQPMMRMEPKIASFDFFMDYSGSMMMNHKTLKEKKIVLARDLMMKVNKKVPALPYDAAMHTFAPYSERLALGAFDSVAMDKALQALSTNEGIRGRFTPMGDGIMKVQPAVHPMKREGAVILVSDGESNMGSDPVTEAKVLYNTEPGICLHVVSFADTPTGEETLKQISALNGCSVYANGPELLANEAALDQFMQDVFYRMVEEQQVTETAPVQETAPEAEAIVLRNVNFAFDSAEITNDSAAILTEAAMLIKDRPGTIVLTGHTDSTGPDAYNQKLSERRAQSVRAFLAKQGISADRITAVGKGEADPEYDNKTSEGRRLNRRVVITFE
ncbi:OmpA family protein [Desulfovibrio subterraneus]|jgi:OOP family OmpA-OmpF porin|uniref:Membrane protein n=1 Tax=Desulfovibrio subterraneus TaxID=2718620 RepID=A0A7J0BM21_9BACT|nr:OmpA family protein [Desulfovibrio subterraneus]GFM34281.1 membrane protein [Desulfovibrio subterraneus]